MGRLPSAAETVAFLRAGVQRRLLEFGQILVARKEWTIEKERSSVHDEV
jgi:hypothetical protein